MESESSGPGTQLQEKGAEVAAQTQQRVRETTQEARGQASDRLRTEVDKRSTQFGAEAQTFASAVRSTADRLRSEGKSSQARIVEDAADRVERAGTYLRNADAERILDDAEGFAQRRPWLVGAAAAVAGFMASRLLKASGDRRFQARQTSTYRSYGGQKGI